jgi:hypothetical protein
VLPSETSIKTHSLGVDPARVRDSGPSWKLWNEDPQYIDRTLEKITTKRIDLNNLIDASCTFCLSLVNFHDAICHDKNGAERCLVCWTYQLNLNLNTLTTIDVSDRCSFTTMPLVVTNIWCSWFWRAGRCWLIDKVHLANFTTWTLHVVVSCMTFTWFVASDWSWRSCKRDARQSSGFSPFFLL